MESLKSHYNEVNSEFVDEIGVTSSINLSPSMISVAANMFVDLSDGRAVTQSRNIVNTSTFHMNKSKQVAIKELSKEGIPRVSKISELATKLFRSKTINQIANLSITETQWSSEGTKLTTAKAANTSDKRQIIKTWFTELDERVRKWHQDAEQQRRNAEQPFSVGGQLLMFPADTNLTATLPNVVRCRCSALYEYGEI
jgi:hypothetical protein